MVLAGLCQLYEAAAAIAPELASTRARHDRPRAPIALPTNETPVAAAGLGSRPLLALDIELAGTATGGIFCLDERQANGRTVYVEWCARRVSVDPMCLESWCGR